MNFPEYFIKNLVYCEDTHSFTHRLHLAFKQNPDMDKNEAQERAVTIITEMEKEYEKL